MSNEDGARKKVYGRDARLQEIRRMVNRPEGLDDVTVNMVYTILYDNGGSNHGKRF